MHPTSPTEIIIDSISLLLALASAITASLAAFKASKIGSTSNDIANEMIMMKITDIINSAEAHILQLSKENEKAYNFKILEEYCNRYDQACEIYLNYKHIDESRFEYCFRNLIILAHSNIYEKYKLEKNYNIGEFPNFTQVAEKFKDVN